MKISCDLRRHSIGVLTTLCRFRVASFDKVSRGTGVDDSQRTVDRAQPSRIVERNLFNMLMITVEADAPTVTTLRLDGRLAGPGIRELVRSWSAAARKRPHRKVLLDLIGVTSVDALGKDFLAQAYRQGSGLIAGAATRAIVEEVHTRSETHCDSSDRRDRSTTVDLESGTEPWIVQVEGKLQAPLNSELSQKVEAALVRGERRVLLNLSRLADIDAAGIGELVRIFSMTRAVGAVLQVAHASPYVKRLLDITGLHTLLSAAA
jgi:anti-anti-sigma factor